MQNLSYFWRRIGAYIIDLSIISMISRIILSFISPIFLLTGTNLMLDIFKFYLFLMAAVIIAVGYNVGCYHYFKFPLGKLLMSIKVYNHRGRRVSTRDYAKREFNKFIYTYATLGLYVPYQFLRYAVKKEQTFHERQSNTYIYM